MKRIDWILLISVASYNFLFYEQSAGINFLIFTLFLIACLLGLNKTLLKQRNWQIAAIGCLISGISVCLYGNEFSVVMNIISLSLLSMLSGNEKSSVILSLVFAMYSYASSPIYMIVNAINNKTDEISERRDMSKRVILVGIPVVITLIFFFMYRSSNALFDDLASKINLDFISWGWIFFTIGGLILLYGFFRPEKIIPLANWDNNTPNNLSNSTSDSNTLILFNKEIGIVDEDFSGKLLFILLNAMLLLVNALDFNFLFINHKLPQGVNYSQFVHQGIDMLITSILVAIIIILFYFRGSLNFYKRNKTIKILAYLWIIQNGVMLFSSACRNLIYINERGLTYKRIGVYVYLLLTIIGLFTTLIKISKAKSNNFLFKINGWVIYTVLILFSLFRWDSIITGYNLSHTLKFNDMEYLVKLSDSNIPDLISVYSNPINRMMEIDTAKEMLFGEEYSMKLYTFLSNNPSIGWKSWCYENQRVHDEITDKPFSDKINYLNLSDQKIPDFSFSIIKVFSNLEELDLHSCGLTNSRDLSCFSSLKHLDLSSNKLLEINGLGSLKHLEYLNLTDNGLLDYSPIYKLTNLKDLFITIVYRFQYDKLKQNLPNTKIHSNFH